MSTDQTLFRTALLASHAPVPAGLGDGRGRPAGRRFDVYRNNVAASLTDVLEVGFPAVRRLIGPTNFRTVMGAFLRAHPPESPVLSQYGAALPDFLAGYPRLAHLGYLPDVAALEQALRVSYHAADAAPIDPATLQDMAPDTLLAARVTLAPALRVLRSRWPVHAIWAFNMQDGAPKPPAIPQDVIVTRPQFDPQMAVPSAGGAAFVLALQAGSTLGAAHDAALEDAPEFDLSAILGLLIGGNAICRITEGDTP